MSKDSNSPRSRSLVPPYRMGWSFVWMAVGVVGMVFLFFLLFGGKSDEQTPKYVPDTQIVPRTPRDDSSDQPEIGAPEATEST